LTPAFTGLPVLRSPAWGTLTALVTGALLPLAFSPFDLWPLAVLLPALLLWLWEGRTPLAAAWRGACFGLGAFGAGLYWVFISLHDYGNAPPIFAVLATLSLVLIMALYPAATGWLLNRGWPQPGPLRWLLVAPALWAGLEWVRSWLFTGFPWLALGYSQIDSPLAGLAPTLGVFGVSWAVLASAGLLLMLAVESGRRRLWAGGLLLLLWIGAWGLGRIAWVEPVGAPLRISLIQPSFAWEQRLRPDFLEETLRRYVDLSLAVADASDVIVWPETAIPMFFHDAEPFIEQLATDARQRNVDYLIGILSGEPSGQIYYNSVISLGRAQGFYHKHRLLPFGEYLPLRSLLTFFRDYVDIPLSDFTPGARNQPPLQAGGQPVGVSICFEAVFGSEIRPGTGSATWLINVSNDSWFGRSPAPYQHLQIARMRALESGRYLARATNTGVSALIDARGRVLAHSGLFTAEIVQGTVQPLAGMTPYVRLGDGFTAVLLGTALALGGLLTRRRSPVPAAIPLVSEEDTP
jgi:apolipoprotein N-acyltransferase